MMETRRPLIVYIPAEGERIDGPPSDMESTLGVRLPPPEERFEGIPGQ